jgi:hypothetical protein
MNDTAPYGIISYEFAGDVASATRILESWGVQGRLVAGLHIGLDYSFLIFYSLAIALGCTLIAQASRMISLRKFGYPLAWLQLTAAILDALENYGLIRILLGSDSQFWAILAFWCASVKFLFVGLGILYVILGSFLSRLPVRTD